MHLHLLHIRRNVKAEKNQEVEPYQVEITERGLWKFQEEKGRRYGFALIGERSTNVELTRRIVSLESSGNNGRAEIEYAKLERVPTDAYERLREIGAEALIRCSKNNDDSYKDGIPVKKLNPL